MFITSLKRDSELYDLRSVPFLIRDGITFEHYLFLFQNTGFLIWFRNTLVVAFVPMVISLAVSIPAGYALARLRFRGATLIATSIFALYLMPPTVLFLPLAWFVSAIGLSNSLWSLIITFPTFMIPFCIWMLSAYFRTLPSELEDVALVDGCTRLQMLWNVIIPLSLPGVITSSFFSFLLAWDNLIYAVAFISDSAQKTISAGVVTELIRGDVFFWGSLMAGAAVAALPVVIAFVFLMDHYVSGLTAGAIK